MVNRNDRKQRNVRVIEQQLNQSKKSLYHYNTSTFHTEIILINSCHGYATPLRLDYRRAIS